MTHAHKIDARKCISYLTIEYKGHIEAGLRRAMGNRIYGCDDCLAVCPWNKFARTTHLNAFHPRAEIAAPLLARLARLDDPAFRALFAGSPIKRIGRDRFLRNVLIAIGNSDERALLPEACRLLTDASALVRAMAVWAAAQLSDRAAFLKLKAQYQGLETDAHVQSEWQV